MKHSNRLTRKQAVDAAIKAWQQAPHDDCLLFAGAVLDSGYGQMRDGVSGRVAVHRYALTVTAGAPPAGHEAMHSCRNRHCYSPAHLSWGTATENCADKVRDGTSRHGEANPFSKLTAASVGEIRTRYTAGGVTQSALAAEFGVDPATVCYVVNGKSWAHVGLPDHPVNVGRAKAAL